ncbi:YciK family oxidoreductase [Alkalilimnicola sp. S0819]|uniref:YciK family oxidoreductase n=1 Tax=Alkalilimnicola sp. S0819 TaxID=2613922 RepID=UPI0012613FBC|nr:YciK family oxidoreductase [Alkalilimnicola sp. S0819]KAB7623673.1 YciK family oxidoreductase [Alkalilimnicola sp. S0819]MPQ16799.1 YciK family oxidoreductase [Alkalilimnicola sp. S0819]
MSDHDADTLIYADYDAPLDLLQARAILVTGAANGIGRAVALALANHGATVILLDKDLRNLETAYDAIENNGAPQPALYPLNLEGASPEDYEQLAASLRENFGRLDGLVHVAAALGKPAPLELYDIEQWYRSLQTNLNGPFLLTRACLPLLRESDAASVLFTSDAAGREKRAYQGAYGVGKAGIEGMMRVLAAETEGSSDIRVNSLDPGPTRTALRRNAYPGENAARLPAPDAVAGAFVYLMGRDGRHLHGQALRVLPADAK